MNQTTVVNVKVKHLRPVYDNLEEWMKDEENVYIGRQGVVFVNGKRFPATASPFANPFKIGKTMTRDDVIAQYRTYIKDKIRDGKVDLAQLRGKNLGCWCKPEPCHGDVLVDLLQESGQI